MRRLVRCTSLVSSCNYYVYPTRVANGQLTRIRPSTCVALCSPCAFQSVATRPCLMATSMRGLQARAEDRCSPLSNIPATDDSVSLTGQIHHLQNELANAHHIIKSLIELVDCAKHGERLQQLRLNIEGGGGMFIVATSEELLEALQTPGSRIVLMEGRTYVLSPFTAVTIQHTHVTIIGNNSNIVGHIRVHNKAVLDASDVFFFAPCGVPARASLPGEAWEAPSMVEAGVGQASPPHLAPVIEATMMSSVFLRNCRLSNGRDGVYLGIQSQARLDAVCVVNCVRGVYEGVGCDAVCNRCTFSGNFYHVVMLGPEKRSRASALISPVDGSQSNGFEVVATAEQACPAGVLLEGPLFSRSRRADVVLDHDPINDVYEDCEVDGQAVQLPPDMATAGLSDPVY